MTETIAYIKESLRNLYPSSEVSSLVRLIMERVCNIQPHHFLFCKDKELSENEKNRIHEIVERLKQMEPIQYILGTADFYSLQFEVDPSVLIPRPETEELVEQVILDNADKRIKILDIGTGSGCIAVTLCAERPDWRGLMVDLSGRALAVACQNAVRHDVRQRLQPVRADFTRPLLRPESLDLLVSNPPYVGKTEYEGLSAEVRDFEPVTALVPNFVDSDKIPSHDHHHDHGGSHSHAPSTPPDKPEGLEHLIAVAQEAFVALKPGGQLLMEHGCAQGAAIKVLLESHNWENVLILKDLSGHDRVASARKPAA